MKYLTLLVLALAWHSHAADKPPCQPEFIYADGWEFVEFTAPGETCLRHNEKYKNDTDRKLLCFFSFRYPDGMGRSGFDQVRLFDVKTCQQVTQ